MNGFHIDRRQVLRGTCAAAATSLWSKHALAQSNYGFRQGEFDITVLSDGFISVPVEIVMPDGTAEQHAELAGRLDTGNGVVRSKANIPVIRTGKDVILVDIGAGHKYQPSDGRLADNLKAAGIDPSTVTKVLFTHAHPDHIWATLADDGNLRFPNATYYVGASEWNFWMDPDYLTSMPAVLHEFARGAQRDLGAVKARIVMLKPGDEVVTGLSVLDTPGHTPGHLSFELAGREGLIITADTATNEIVSFEHPDWRFGYDMLPETAIKTRRSLLDRAAADKVKLLGYHWTYPGVGYAERKDGAFRFLSGT